MSPALFALGRTCFRHRTRVALVWLAVVVVLAALAGLVGKGTSETYSVPGSQSQQTVDDLRGRFPEMAGHNGQIVLLVPEGQRINTPARREAVAEAVVDLKDVTSVLAVTDPLAPPAKGEPDLRHVSEDQRAAIINIQLQASEHTVSPATKSRVVQIADGLRSQGMTTEVGGGAFANPAPQLSWVEGLSLILALAVLLIFFRSIRGASAPLVTAVTAAATTFLLLMVATAVATLTGTAPMLALMLCIAVGIDYSLFLLSRFLEFVRGGVEPSEAAARATATAGSAVVFAGLTVVTALLGLVIVGLPFLSAMGVSAAAGVAVAVIAAITLGPALMGILSSVGLRRAGLVTADAKAASASAAPGADTSANSSTNTATVGPDREDESEPGTGAPGAAAANPRWPVDPEEAHTQALGTVADAARSRGRRWQEWWILAVTRWPALTVILLTGVLVTLAVPAKDLRLALPDNGTAPATQSERRAYDIVADHFGPGENGPLLVVADIISSKDPLGAMDDLRDRVEAVPGVARVTLSTPNRSADTGVVIAIPTTAPGDPATADLVQRLRDEAPRLAAGHDISVRVAGQTASQIDVSERLARALVPFGAVVIGLSLLLLLIVFRSLVVPITAAAGFLLSVGAAFGVVTAVFEWGWASSLLEVARVGPIISFLPIILMGVLFGLAMDYQVFIVSRMHEHYTHHGDPKAAVHEGFLTSAGVVAAAAIIMVGVFAAFVPKGDASLKPIALGLAVGVFIDAFLVRMMLVPAALHLLGRLSWALPAVFAARLPHLDVEGQGVVHQIAAEETIASHPDRVVHARGLRVSGPRGDTFDGLDLDLYRGQLAILLAEEGGGKTAALLAFAGRLALASGDLDVAGAVIPEQATLVQRRVALAEFALVNPLDDDLDVRTHVAERLAPLTLLPWSRRRDQDAVLSRFDEACDVAAWALTGEDGDPIVVDATTRVGDLSRLQRLLLGVILALVGDPAVIVVDDIDQLPTEEERAACWAVLGWVTRQEGQPAVLAACRRTPEVDDLLALTGLRPADLHVVPLPSTAPVPALGR